VQPYGHTPRVCILRHAFERKEAAAAHNRCLELFIPVPTIGASRWGRMFVRMCPYFPFSARVYLNQHHWLAIRMREEGIDFQQSTNAFLRCGNPGAVAGTG
jgi:hypothetical protein